MTTATMTPKNNFKRKKMSTSVYVMPYVRVSSIPSMKERTAISFDFERGAIPEYLCCMLQCTQSQTVTSMCIIYWLFTWLCVRLYSEKQTSEIRNVNFQFRLPSEWIKCEKRSCSLNFGDVCFSTKYIRVTCLCHTDGIKIPCNIHHFNFLISLVPAKWKFLWNFSRSKSETSAISLRRKNQHGNKFIRYTLFNIKKQPFACCWKARISVASSHQINFSPLKTFWRPFFLH